MKVFLSSRATRSSFSLTHEMATSGKVKATGRLTDDQVHRARGAAAKAIEMGMPLNRFITINWEQGGVSDVAAATRAFLRSARGWCDYNGQSSASIWTIENSVTFGLHAHILIHVPQHLGRAFGLIQRRWLSGLGCKRIKGGVLTRHLGGRPAGYKSLLLSMPDPEIMKNYDRVVAYILKCCSFESSRSMGNFFSARQSDVPGERLGISRNIGPSSTGKKAFVHDPHTGSAAFVPRTVR